MPRTGAKARERAGGPVGRGVSGKAETQELFDDGGEANARQAGQPGRARCRRACPATCRARTGRGGPGWPHGRIRLDAAQGFIDNRRSAKGSGSISQMPEPSRRTSTRKARWPYRKPEALSASTPAGPWPAARAAAQRSRPDCVSITSGTPSRGESRSITSGTRLSKPSTVIWAGVSAASVAF